MSGDLISRSALLEALKKSRNHHANNEREHSLLCRCENIVREQPTIEAVPVVHGEWIEFDDDIDVWYECSECESYSTHPTNFCPKCGAKMKGGAEW